MAYDIIVVGSGNGACGFLSRYLELNPNGSTERLLVIEEGDDFFNTSDITHQNNWTQSYAEGDIFKLHNALTPNGTPIISGRACTMGGGGSINYTMIHESSQWLATQIGQTEEYWNCLKASLNQKFNRPDPGKDPTPPTKHILQAGQQVGFEVSPDSTANIPNFSIGNTGLLHLFPTQFNAFGQRTNSGVSLLNWFDKRVELKTQSRVEQIQFSPEGEPACCLGVHVRDLNTGKTEFLPLSTGGKLILCAGAATPKLLLPHRERLQNQEIGQHVSDHIVLPLGIYVANKKLDVLPRDVYVPVFATTVWQPNPGQQGQETACCFDFFAGSFEKLWFFIAHLYLSFLLPNWLKRIVIKTPWLFYIMKNAVRLFIQSVNFMINVGWKISDLLDGNPWDHEKLDLVTAIVKFNPAQEGRYSDDGSRIELNFFATDPESRFNQDKEVAKSIITEHLKLMNELGQQPHWLIKCLFRLFTKIPYNQKQVADYIDLYSRKFLLSEQHLSGGCLFGKAIDPGLDHPMDTGRVYGSANVYVADLSAVPLPRISTQMTAYLIGFHVANRLRGQA